MPDIPTFDGSVVAFLKLLQVNEAVIALVVFAFVVFGWYDGIRKSISAAKTTGSATKRVIIGFATGPAKTVTTAIVAAAVLAGQAIGVAGWYVMGNIISQALVHDRQRDLQMMRSIEQDFPSEDAALVRFLNGFLTLIPYIELKLDLSSGICLLLAAVLLFRSYAKAHQESRGTTFMFCAPLVFFFVLGPVFTTTISALIGIIAAIAAFCGGSWDVAQAALLNWALPSLPWALLGVMYAYACVKAIDGSRTVLLLFRTP